MGFKRQVKNVLKFTLVTNGSLQKLDLASADWLGGKKEIVPPIGSFLPKTLNVKIPTLEL